MTKPDTPSLKLENGDIVTAETYDEYVNTPRPFGTLTPDDYHALAMFASLLAKGKSRSRR